MIRALNRIRPGLADIPGNVDVVVAGLGATGAGVALDAASRGLRVLAVDAHDLAFGTSRWSSKLVHGGLRYLAHGDVGVAHESAIERGLLLDVIAPHLTHATPMLMPLTDTFGRAREALTRSGLLAGDLLRGAAHTPSHTLPRPRRISAAETLALAPGLRVPGLRGGLLSWDGQLEDDARLVITLARTATEFAATVRTRARVLAHEDTRVILRDEITGSTHTVTTQTLINATGVWAAGLDPDVSLRPSRGSHLVLRSAVLPGLRTAVTCPVPHTTNRFILVLPQPDQTIYVGLTDEPVSGPIPDVAHACDYEIGFLLDVVGAVFSRPLRRADVAGTFAGLRPLLETGAAHTSDLSRRHVVRNHAPRRITVVGGKLTTYRRMAQDAVDAAVHLADLDADPCHTARLPLLGAAMREHLTTLEQPSRLVRRFGADASLVLDTAREVSGLGDDELLEPVGHQVPATLAEMVFGVTHEGAHDVADLLERRTRCGLIAADRAAALPVAQRALALAAHSGSQWGDFIHPK